jgi:hypothetical protein
MANYIGQFKKGMKVGKETHMDFELRQMTTEDQDNCVLNFRQTQKIDGDPRMAELAAMGLPDYWLKVADYLGFDAFWECGGYWMQMS